MACLFADAGLVAVVALISPYAESRQRARQLHQKCGLAVRGGVPGRLRQPSAPTATRKDCTRRASEGSIESFTGVDDPYEVPDAPDLVIESGTALHHAVDAVMETLVRIEGGPI